MKHIYLFTSFLLLLLCANVFNVYGQACAGSQLSARINNITLTAPNKIEFDFDLKNTGTTTVAIAGVLQSSFIYNAIALNGGTLAATAISTSMNPTSTSIFSIQTATNTITWTSTITSSTGIPMSGPGASANWHSFYHITLTNSVPFSTSNCFVLTAPIPPTNFCVSAYCNGNTTLSNLCIAQGNLQFSGSYFLPSTNCPTLITTSTTNAPCINGTGSLQVSLNSINANNGYYTIDAGSGIPFNSNPFTVTNLSTGAHTISVTLSNSCNASCSILTNTFQILFNNNVTSNTTNISVCDSFLWSVNNQIYYASGTYNQQVGCTNEILNLIILPPPLVSANNGLLCINSSVNLVGNPAGGIFNVPNPYSGVTPSTFTYTYTNSAGCSASANGNITGINIISPQINTPIIATISTATIGWNSILGATSYLLSYKPINSSSWLTLTTINNSAILSNLLPNTIYIVRIKSYFASCSQSSPFSNNSNFLTLNSACNTPTTISAINVPIKKIKFTWASINGVAQYNIWYRMVGANTWLTAVLPSSTTNFTTITLPVGTYEYKIRNRCNTSTTFSIFSNLQNVAVVNKGVDKELTPSFSVFPNPTEGNVNMELVSLKAYKGTIKLYNIIGKLVKQMPVNIKEGINNYQFDLRELANSLYIMQVYEDGKLTYVKKIKKL
jgi:hypothetical protein